VGRLTKLQRSLDATAWRDCLPRSGQGFYDRACLGRVTPDTQVGYDWMAHRHLPSPDLHRRDGQPYGLRPKETKRSEKREKQSVLTSSPFFSSSFVFSALLSSFLFFRFFLSEKQDVAPWQCKGKCV
jgi:hypothetical protein